MKISEEFKTGLILIAWIGAIVLLLSWVLPAIFNFDNTDVKWWWNKPASDMSIGDIICVLIVYAFISRK